VETVDISAPSSNWAPPGDRFKGVAADEQRLDAKRRGGISSWRKSRYLAAMSTTNPTCTGVECGV
jgi:hypothetical protein